MMKKFKKSSGEILSNQEKVTRRLIAGIIILYTFITILVLVITFMNSFKTNSELIGNLFGFPSYPTLQNYDTIFIQSDFLRYFRNSVILSVGGTLGSTLLAAMTAYGISRYKFKGKGFFSAYFLVGMMIPVQVSVLPLFVMLRRFGLLNRLEGLILVYIAGISLSTFVLQKFFRTLPQALEESARIDGAGEFRIFWSIMLPLAKPVLSTVALISIIGQWNDFFMPMVLLNTAETRTLTLAISRYLADFTRNMSVAFAAVTITLIPVIILYFVFNKQIVEGITGGAVKG